MSECSTFAINLSRSCPIHHSVIQPDQFRCDYARDEAAEAERDALREEVESLTGLLAACMAERDALKAKIDLALDIPIRVYREGSVNDAEAEWHRGWNDAVEELHDAINPEIEYGGGDE